MQDQPAPAIEGERRAGAGRPRGAPQRAPSPPRVWRRRSAAGALFTGIAFGFKEALDPEPEGPAIVAPAPSAPPDLSLLELHLDRDRPEEAWAVVRPWLAADSRPSGTESGG